MDRNLEEELVSTMGRLMVVFKGGITYGDFMEMPLTELPNWINLANKITKEQNTQS